MANAYEQTLPVATPGQDRMYPTITDLSAYQYKFVKVDTDNLLVACGAGEEAIGILQDAPVGTATALKDGTVRLFGQSRLVLGGTVTGGQCVKSDGSALGVAATADHDKFAAVAKSGGVANDLIVVTVERGTISA